ncbi:polyamine-transporting ATPase 13A3 isoform X3 [Frankliniella occidentalis]|uniref:Cation-transporting ATPase n=1 Tax=Frankliniella occidentalis TaxID=133901 RepID=A0A9C6X229_FRAOC|nr:polyamine-transporting ATPase 13A3 isoform X3 [Frankliniella occidentalis]
MSAEERSFHHGYERLDRSLAHQQIEIGTDDGEFIHCFGYQHCTIRLWIYWISSVLFIGTPTMLLAWYPQFAAIRYKPCSLDSATIVLIRDSNGLCSLHEVQLISHLQPNSAIVEHTRTFSHRLLQFVWMSGKGFQRLRGLSNGQMTLASLLDSAQGLSKQEQDDLQELYGPNHMEVEVKSYWKLFVSEVFNPFYLFQAFSIVLWSADEYYYYAACVLFLTAVSVIASLFQTKKQSLALRNLVEASNCCRVMVCRRGGECEEVAASCLVPGDVILVPSDGCVMPCDAMMLAGTCIVNESMLTGESAPVTKSSPPHSDEIYDPHIHRRHTLFCGTQVIQTRYYGNHQVSALVIRTGFSTSKGELLRSVMFPKPMGFRFYEDSLKFVTFLFFVAAFGMSYCVYLYVQREASSETITLRTLDIITIVVPPALPAAMTAGTVFSQSRLKKKGIFCISPPRINVCGKIKMICFDKTGTLTEDGLNFWAVLPIKDQQFSPQPVWNPSNDLPTKSHLLVAMACCHALTRIHNELCGDPLDLSMFEATQWELEEPGGDDTTRYDMLAPTVVRPRSKNSPSVSLEQSIPNDDDVWNIDDEFNIPYEVGIMRQFPFSSTVQCMSVVVRTLGAHNMAMYTKGAPEKIVNICLPETVPENFSQVLSEFTSSGYRVIALAHKPLESKLTWPKVQRVKREQIEKDMHLVGLLIMQNSLKPETTPVIHQLQSANIRTVMITGDNLMTAVSVSRDCGMISRIESVLILSASAPDPGRNGNVSLQCLHGDPPPIEVLWSSGGAATFHLALDGRTWAVIRTHFPELLPTVITQGTVFARMAPDQKTQLVEQLMAMDYVVAMCGDGANDVGALKAAHIGVSLSEAEASVAAPFTSREVNINCVLHLIREGRCALTTSFETFKYMAMYSLIQFITVLILYTEGAALSNLEFLFVDLGITTTLAVTLGRTGPAPGLTHRRPVGSLVSLSNLVPLGLQVVLCFFVQWSALKLLQTQSWYEHVVPTENDDDEGVVVCWENTAVYCVSCFQYLVLAAVYSKGAPFRQPFYTNLALIGMLAVLTVFSTLLLVYPFEPLAGLMEFVPLDFSGTQTGKMKNWFRVWLIFLPLFHLAGSATIENFVAETRWLKVVLHWISRKRSKKNKYKKVDHITSLATYWPTSQGLPLKSHVEINLPAKETFL